MERLESLLRIFSLLERLKSLLRIFSLLLLINVLVGCSVLSGSDRAHILVQWTTGSEINTAGFNLYRSDKAEGPFTRINARLVPATNDPIAGGKYQYQDDDVRSGQTYYYELEDVELNGTSTRHGPIVIVAPAAAFTDSVMPVALLLGLGVLALFAVGSLRRARRVKSTEGAANPKAPK